jgi:hypothetical protein
VQVDERHASGEARDRLGDLFLASGALRLGLATFPKRLDVPLERGIEASGFGRRNRRAVEAPSRFLIL